MNAAAASTGYPPTVMDKIMTLKPYTPDRLDELALRLLDLAGRVRTIALACRQEKLDHVELHDRKALEHLDRVEEWLYKAEADQKVASVKNQGRQHAKKMQSRQAK
jgi:hypothetical protein